MKETSLGQSKTLRTTFFLGAASFFTSGINYLTTPVFTRILSTEEYGMVSIYNTVYTIMSVACTLTLARPGVLNVGLYDHRDNRWKYLSSMLGLIAVASVSVGVIIGIFWDLLKGYIKIPFSLFLLSLLCCMILPATTFWTVKNRYEYSYKLPFVVSVGSALISQGAAIAAVIVLKDKGYNLAEVRLWTANIVNILAAVVIYVFIVMKGKTYVDRPLWAKTLKFTFPLIPHYLGFAILNGTDKLMIANMIGQDKTGIYSLSSVLSHIGTILWSALCISFTPFIHAKLGQKDYGSIRMRVKPLIILISAACIGITLVAPEIVWIMGSEKYAEGVHVVPAVMGGLFMHIMYDTFSSVSFFRKKSVSIMIATAAAAVINIVTNYIFIKRYGYIAAGYTTLFSYCVLAVLHYMISCRTEGCSVFDRRFSAAISAVTVVLCLACLYIYEYRAVRLALFAVLFIAVILKRRYFLDNIAKMEI
ncbi:MAG: oligosaccharide flippase family protein [Firmicutes bacterium]|nr:oligosaccharide flippase family protein [Bacillota bacterium]MBQ3931293.1 oligosaccharide flippase family protein [Bacillota bacterium]